jgi:hypothetical protein
MIHSRQFLARSWWIRTQQTSQQAREGGQRKTARRRRTHTRITKSSENTNTGAKVHNTVQTREKLRQLHYMHKISNIFPAHTFRRINEAFFDKKRVHDFPFGPIKVSGGKGTTALRGHRKSTPDVDLHFFGFPSRSTNSRRFLLTMIS